MSALWTDGEKMTATLMEKRAESYYEDYYYKILVALTSPSLQHYKYSTFNFTPTANIYSAFKIYVRYGSLATNYLDMRSPPSPLDGITLHTNAEGAITGSAATSSFFYVNQADVETIDNARYLWFKRLHWLMTTSPTRIKVENVAADTESTQTITVGANGSFITHYFGSAYKASIEYDRAAVGTWRQIITNIESRYDVVGENSHGYSNGLWLTPLYSTIDSDAITYRLYVKGSRNELNFVSYAMIEKYDVPSWWDTFE